MHRTIGESNGTTQLAMPPEDTSQFMNEKEKNYQLETCERPRLLACHRRQTASPMHSPSLGPSCVENHC